MATRDTHRWLAGALLGCVLLFAAQTSRADDDALKQLLVAYLQDQTAQMGGEVDVTVTMPRITMSECRAPQPFLPGRNPRVVGNITIGVRCPGDRPSTRYYQAHVSVITPYYVAARALHPGDVVTAADLRRETGDISRMSAHIATDANALIGMATVRRIAPGMPLSDTMVKPPTAIDRGDQVRVIASGPGFSITTDGQALNAAPLGGQVRVSTRDGAVVTGVSTDQNTVTVHH